jgi:hypothetical protein
MKRYDSSYPGSMFEKPEGDYVSFEDAEQDRAAAFADGLAACSTIRCVAHREVPPYNHTEAAGKECAACAVADLKRQVPGAIAKHAIVTRTCIQNRGMDGAVDEALDLLRGECHVILNNWGHQSGVVLHFVLSMEKPSVLAACPPAAEPPAKRAP